MKFLLKYLSPLKWRMVLGFSIKVVGTVVELFLPLILTHILENVIGDMNITRVVLFGALMILCALTACICNIVANRMASRVSKDFSGRMRKDLFDRIMYGLISRIMVKEIRLVGRLSKGVRIMDLRKNDRITGANVVVEVDAPETPAMKEEDLVIAAAGVPVKKEVSEEVTDVPEIPENGEEGSSSTEE